MKFLIIFLATLFSFGWFGNNFKIIDATSQKYAGGHEKSGYGTRYNIKLIAKKNSKKLKIDQLWIGEEYFDVKPIKDPKHKNDHEFSKNDTINLYIKHHIHTDEEMKKTQKNKNKVKLPYKYQGAALIGYKIRNKRKYKVIEKFTVLEKIFYP
ncbi:MAG: hypothetical protein ABFS35_11965 [Bacteroidota bacterium]